MTVNQLLEVLRSIPHSERGVSVWVRIGSTTYRLANVTLTPLNTADTMPRMVTLEVVDQEGNVTWKHFLNIEHHN